MSDEKPEPQEGGESELSDLEKMTLYLSGDADEAVREEISRRMLVKGGDLLDERRELSQRASAVLGGDGGDGTWATFEGMTEEEWERWQHGDAKEQDEIYYKYAEPPYGVRKGAVAIMRIRLRDNISSAIHGVMNKIRYGERTEDRE